MAETNNLKEKRLLLAYYFCERTEKEITINEVFSMWCSRFRDDFEINGELAFKMVNGILFYYRGIKPAREKTRRQCDHMVRNVYKWIKKAVEKEGHGKIYFRKELDKEHNRGYGRVINLAKEQGIYIKMYTSYKKLAKFRLMYCNDRKDIITSGDCDSMVRYLEDMKNRRQQGWL